MVLELAGSSTTTGGSQAAADLLAWYGWIEGTWAIRLSQIRRWRAFFDEDGRSARPAGEGDVITYFGYLSMEGNGGPTSARQYFSAVSRNH